MDEHAGAFFVKVTNMDRERAMLAIVEAVEAIRQKVEAIAMDPQVTTELKPHRDALEAARQWLVGVI